MGKLRLLKAGHGDLVLAEWKDTETIEYARIAFDRERLLGRMAFRLDGPGLTTPIVDFEEAADEILLVPAVVGG